MGGRVARAARARCRPRRAARRRGGSRRRSARRRGASAARASLERQPIAALVRAALAGSSVGCIDGGVCPPTTSPAAPVLEVGARSIAGIRAGQPAQMSRRFRSPPPRLLAALAARAGAGARPRSASRRHGFAPRQLVVKFGGEARGAHDRPAAAASASREAAARAAAKPERRIRRSPTTSPPPRRVEARTVRSPTTPARSKRTAGSAPPGGWASKQWNFLALQRHCRRRGCRSPPAGSTRSAPGRTWKRSGGPAPKASTVAVLDTGIAYRDCGTDFLRSPDFAAGQFVHGYDFVDHDRLPLDENGHGTHVAGTIAEKTNNGIGLTGLAYRAKLMPVRVLDAQRRGYADRDRQGDPLRRRPPRPGDQHELQLRLRREGARRSTKRCAKPTRTGSSRSPRRQPRLARACVSEPATGPRVIGVGGTTEGGCLGSYSLAGTAIDVVAPGGGTPVAGCPSISSRPIYQVTLKAGSTDRIRDPEQLRRHLDGRRPRLRRRRDGPRQRRARPAADPASARRSRVRGGDQAPALHRAAASASRRPSRAPA